MREDILVSNIAQLNNIVGDIQVNDLLDIYEEKRLGLYNIYKELAVFSCPGRRKNASNHGLTKHIGLHK